LSVSTISKGFERSSKGTAELDEGELKLLLEEGESGAFVVRDRWEGIAVDLPFAWGVIVEVEEVEGDDVKADGLIPVVAADERARGVIIDEEEGVEDELLKLLELPPIFARLASGVEGAPSRLVERETMSALWQGDVTMRIERTFHQEQLFHQASLF
jgi:hypothetical protein